MFMAQENKIISIAPMMDCTDRHYRYLMRLITRHTTLYTEMITTGAILHGDRERFLAYDQLEHPVVLQLGGCDPNDLAQCCRYAEQAGYDEVNLNVGCPSDRVQKGRIGACLMNEPELVAECIGAMQEAVSIPATIKTRLGVDHNDSYEALCRFVELSANAGCETFIIHARKAWLKGLNPKQNREVPPLHYDRVYQLKQDFPHLNIQLNGGVHTLAEVAEHLQHTDGVMLGRAPYAHPYLMSEVDRLFYADDHPVLSQLEVVEQYLPYIEAQLKAGVRLRAMARHLVGLFQGMPGARAWRRYLSENAGENSVKAVLNALKLVCRGGPPCPPGFA